MLSFRMMGEDSIQEYLHGELPGSSIAAIESALREDPGLAARIRALQSQNKLLQELRADILDEPVPERLMSVLGGADRAGERHQARPLHLAAPPPAGDRGHRVLGARAIVIALGIGIGIGWAVHGALTASAGGRGLLADPRCDTQILHSLSAVSTPLCCGPDC